MIKKIIEFFKSYKTIIIRILFTLLFIFIFQICSLITIPGIKWTRTDKSDIDQFISLLSMMGGGILNKLSIFAIGISPFITTSIVIQLLSGGLIPKFSQWQKQGKKGQIKLNYITKIIMIPFAYIQSIGILFSLRQSGIIEIDWFNENAANSKLFYYFLCPSILVAGTMITLFIAELITQKGIGSGTSIIIFTGIFMSSIVKMKNAFPGISNVEVDNYLKFIIYIVSILILLFLIILLNSSQRKIPIQQSGSGLRLEKEHKTFLPIKLNPSGVIPVIFSTSLIAFFGSIKTILEAKNSLNYSDKNYIYFVKNYLSFESWTGIFIFGILVLLIGWLYAGIAINSEKIAEDFRKNGIYILGIRTGKSTEKYISYVLLRISFFGSLYLSFLAVFSLIFRILLNFKHQSILSGTSLLILVVIGENIIEQIKDLVIQTKYLNFEKRRKDPFLW